MRLLSLAPSNTEILFSLGLEDHIVAVTHLCDYPLETKKKAKIGTWTVTSPEEIKKLSPDFIFTSYFLPPELKNWRGPGEIVHVEPKALDDVLNNIKYIGSITKKIKKARQIVSQMEQEFDQLRKNSPKIQKRVYMEEWPKPPMVSGNWVPELVEIAGGIPVLSEKGKPSFEIQIDGLTSIDPDVLVFHWCGFGEKFNEKPIRNRPDWEKLRAMQNNKLFLIDDSLLNRPGPRLVEGAKRLQEILLSLTK